MRHLHCQHPYKAIFPNLPKDNDLEIPLVMYAADGRYSSIGGYGLSDGSWDLGAGHGIPCGTRAAEVDAILDIHVKQLPKMFEIGIAPILIPRKRGTTNGLVMARAFFPTLDCRNGIDIREVITACDRLLTMQYMTKDQAYSIYSTGNSYHAYFHKPIYSGMIPSRIGEFLKDALDTGCVDAEWVRHSSRFSLGPVLRWTSCSQYKSLITKVG